MAQNENSNQPAPAVAAMDVELNGAKIIADFKEALVKEGLGDDAITKRLEKQIGGFDGANGVKVGAAYTVTGVECSATINGQTRAFPHFTTAEGVIIPFTQLMQFSTLAGYTTEGSLKHGIYDLVAKKQVELDVNLDYKAGDVAKYFKANNHRLEDFIIEAVERIKIGDKLTYRGQIGRQYQAKKTQTNPDWESWEAGQYRVMTVRVWQHN